MADRLSNGFGFGQGFGANDQQQIGGMPNVDQTQQWAQFSQGHSINPNMNPQMAQLLTQRNNAAGAQMQANNFQQHGFLEQQFGATGGLLGGGAMNAIQAQQFSNAARGQPPPPFLGPNNDMVRQMGLLQSQNNPLHQQQAATMQLLNQRLGAHPAPQPPQQAPNNNPNRNNVMLALVQGIGQPQQQRLTQQIMQNLPRMSAEELVSLVRQARIIEADLANRAQEVHNLARGGANTIQAAQQSQEIQKKIVFVTGFAHKINSEVLNRKDKGQFPVQLLQNLPHPAAAGPLQRTLPNGMTNPEWLKAHGAPPDLFTNGTYPQHEVQAAVDRMRQTIINQNAGQQATQSQLAQLQALQQQHNAIGQRAPSRQQGPPNPATPGLAHASPMPQPANVNPQQQPPQQPGGPITSAELNQRLRNLPFCDEALFAKLWPAWAKTTGMPMTMDDVHPPETMQGKPSISLWRLHAAVWQLGGHDNVGERWAQLAGRLGWGIMQDPAGSLAPPMAAERLRQVHASHLKDFDKWYHNLQRQKVLQHMSQMAGQVLAQAPGGQQGAAARLGPEKLQQAIQAAMLNGTADELRARNVGEDVIAFVEANREALVQKHREQTAFKQGLQGQQQAQQQQQQQQQQQANMAAAAAMHPGQQQQNGMVNGNNIGVVQPGQPGQGQGQGHVVGPPPAQVGLTPEQRQALAQRTLQLFGPLPGARDLKGLRSDGSIDPMMYQNAVQSVHGMKKNVEKQLQQMLKSIDPPIDVDRNEWMALLERGSTLAVEIEKTMPMFIAYTQSPGGQLANILSKYIGQIMTLTFQKKLLQERPARFIIDLNALRGFIQQFSNLLVILRNRIQAVRHELQTLQQNQQQQLHRPPSQQGGGPPPPPPGGHMGVGLPGQGQGQQQHPQQLNVANIGRVPTPQHRVPTPQQMVAQGRVPTPAQFPTTPAMLSAEAMPPPLPPAAAGQHKRKPSENAMQSPAAGIAGASPPTPAANAGSPQTPQTPKQKPKPKPKNPRRKSMASTTAPIAVDAGDKDSKDGVVAEASSSAAAPSKGNKRAREEEPSVAAASPKRAKADWEGPSSDAQERRAKEAEEAPRDDTAAAEFVDNMMREFASFEGDATPLVTGINAILASVLPGGTSVDGGLNGAAAVGLDGGLGAGGGDGLDDFLDFSQFVDFDAVVGGSGSGSGSGGGTVGATPELVHGSSTNPSPDSGSEPEPAAAAPSSNNNIDKTPVGFGLGPSSSSSDAGGLFGGALDDPLHIGAWSEIDGGETSYYHGGAGWRWDVPMAGSEQPWAISTS